MSMKSCHHGLCRCGRHAAHIRTPRRVTLTRWMGMAFLIAIWCNSFTQAQVPVVNSAYENPKQTPPQQTASIQQVQLIADPRRPLDRRIEAMPRADQKLEVIHHRSQLIVTKLPIRRMAWSDPSLLDVVQFSPTEISLIGIAQGSTDLWIWFDGQEQPLMYVVTIIRDPSLDEQRNVNYGRIERKLALLYPNSKVYLIPVSRKIIVRGEARDAEEAANIMQLVRGEVIAQEGYLFDDQAISGYGGAGGGAGGFGGIQGGGFGDQFGWNGNNGVSSLIIDELRIPGEFQISINVRIAEIHRSQLRNYGVNWEALINNGAVQLTSTLSGGAPTLTGVFDSGNFTILIDALASNGVAKVLDDARVVTLSGQPAAFLSGGEFAVPTIVGIGGAQGQTTSFRGFGTSIICTPTLLDNDLIRLQIVPELSAINSGNSVGGIPGVNVRRVQTRVELREGQTIALGGVFSRRENAETTRIPFLGELPVVGSWLFNTKRATEDETEMLIIVTPELVRAMDADQVPPLPGWYSTHPNDCDFYKYNRIEGNADMGNYQLLPYGNGQGYGQDVGYNFFNPSPADGQLAPAPTGGAQGPLPNAAYAPAFNNEVYPSDQYGPAPGGNPMPPYIPQQNPQPTPSYGPPMNGNGSPLGVPNGPGYNSSPMPTPAQPTPAATTQNSAPRGQIQQTAGRTPAQPQRARR
ncbi:pilus assembly protein N-terminal domain-containing protein [Planctomicrobium sp. SH661]|uniref:type II and III secretion system protein family protein n=1 Tax=Planctomicrobium sp. SH661 TaxID=3448124 RepID=UPI003F5B0189